MENYSVPALCAGTGKAPSLKFYRDLPYNSNALAVKGLCLDGDTLFGLLRSQHRPIA